MLEIWWKRYIEMYNILNTNNFIYYPNANPITKLIFLLTFIFIGIYSNNIYIYLTLILINFLLLLNSKISFKIIFKHIFSMRYLIIFLFIFNIFYLVNFINNLFVLLIIITSCNLYSHTNSKDEMINSFYPFLKIFKLFKININNLISTIYLSINFIPDILNNAKNIIRNCEYRGIFFFNSSFEDKLKIINALIIPLFSSTLKKSDDLGFNLYLRFYDNYTFVYKQQKYTFRDYTLFYLLFILIFFWRIYE